MTHSVMRRKDKNMKDMVKISSKVSSNSPPSTR